MLTGNVLERDYNFFSSLHAVKRRAGIRVMLLAGSFVLFIVFIGGFFIFTEVKAFKLQKGILEAAEFLNSPETVKKRQEFTQKKMKFEMMNKYYSSVEAVAAAIDSTDRVKSGFLQSVMTTVPQDVTFNTIALTPDQLNIQGVAATRVTIAEFYHNLVSLGLFNNVYVSSMQKDASMTDGNSYNIQCTLKDVIKP